MTLAGEKLTWNMTTLQVECGGLSFSPTHDQARFLSYISKFGGQWVTHRDVIEALHKEANTSRVISDILKRLGKSCRETFGEGTMGVENHRGQLRWLGLVKRVAHLVQGRVLCREDGSPATMDEATEWLAARYGQHPVAKGTAAAHLLHLMKETRGGFHLLAKAPDGRVMVVVAGDELEIISGAGWKAP